MAKRVITFGEIGRDPSHANVRCDRCFRRGRCKTTKLVAQFGADATVQPFQDWITKDCPKRNDPRSPLGTGCAPLMPELRLLPGPGSGLVQLLPVHPIRM